jgi:RimJ/RimL family protein N-acetyltransferase
VLGFSPTLPLETERLRLRAFTADDLDPLFDLHARDDVARWLYRPPWTRAFAEEQIAKRPTMTAFREDGDPILLAIEERESGAFAGDAMFRLLTVEHRTGEIGFVLHPGFHGRGYATETARELLRLGFEDARFHRIVARCEPRNTASAAVMERLGMRLEGHLVENEWVKGEWQSELVYALLEREWPSAAP